MTAGEPDSESGRIALRDAVAAARAYLEEVLAAGGEEATRVLLEEVDSDAANYLITLGYDREAPEPPGLAGYTRQLSSGGRLERAYKVLKVDATTGAVESMKIRPVD